jgi:biotin carboxyl carrier protein
MSEGPSSALSKDQLTHLIRAFRTSDATRLTVSVGASKFWIAVQDLPTPSVALAQVLSPSVGDFLPHAQKRQAIALGEKIGVIKRLGAEVDVLAPQAGEVFQVLQPSGDFVEFGAPLFEISVREA